MKRLLVILIFTLSLFCEVTAASFEEAMSFTLKMEGSTIDKTNGKIHSKYGITKETLNKFNKKYKTNLQLTTLSKTNASNVAKKLLWDIYKLDNVHNNIVGIAMFDLLFNSNPDNASIIIQKTVNQIKGKNYVNVDGNVGNKTISAINEIDPELFVKTLCKNRLTYMKKIKTWSKYGKGWTKRVNSIIALI